jgi:aspartate dehydrogenase
MMRRVGIIGYGAIGSVIAHAVDEGRVPGVILCGILTRHGRDDDRSVTTLDQLLRRRCDLVIEAAGHDAVAQHGVAVMESGADLVVLSAGALADPAVEERIRRAGPGRLLLSTGAIGGLDVLRALRLAGELREVSIVSTAVAAALDGEIEPAAAAAIMRAGAPIELARGTARQISQRFPKSTNVAATVALATLGLDVVTAALRVDPLGRAKRHEITAVTDGGGVRMEIRNLLTPGNPRTSAVTPYAVLRLLLDGSAHEVIGV